MGFDILSILTAIFGSSGRERPSASDILPHSSITQTETYVKIALNKTNIAFTRSPKIRLSTLADTNSMDPSFDYGHTPILIKGSDAIDQSIMIDALHVGDVATYYVAPNRSIIHRIVKIGKDKQGRYFRFKGDNNNRIDPYIVRDENIAWLLVGTIF